MSKQIKNVKFYQKNYGLVNKKLLITLIATGGVIIGTTTGLSIYYGLHQGEEPSIDAPINGKVSESYWNNFFGQIRKYNYHSSESYKEWYRQSVYDEESQEYVYEYYTLGADSELDSSGLINKITYKYFDKNNNDLTATNYRFYDDAHPLYNTEYMEGEHDVGYIITYTAKPMYCYYTTDIADSFNYYAKYKYDEKSKSYKAKYTYRVIDPLDQELYDYPDSDFTITFDDNADKVTLKVVYNEEFKDWNELKGDYDYTYKPNEQTVVFTNVGKVGDIKLPSNPLGKIYDLIEDYGNLCDLNCNSGGTTFYLKENETYSIKEPQYLKFDTDLAKYIDVTSEALKIQPKTFIDLTGIDELNDYVELNEDHTSLKGIKFMDKITKTDRDYNFTFNFCNLNPKYNDIYNSLLDIMDYRVLVCKDTTNDTEDNKKFFQGDSYIITPQNQTPSIAICFDAFNQSAYSSGSLKYVTLSNMSLTINDEEIGPCLFTSEKTKTWVESDPQSKPVLNFSNIYSLESYKEEDAEPILFNATDKVEIKFRANYYFYSASSNANPKYSYYCQDVTASTPE